MAREAAGGGVIRRSSVQAAPATSAPSRRGRREITLFESRDAPPLGAVLQRGAEAHGLALVGDRKSTRLNSSHSQISYAVFCLKKKIHVTRVRIPNHCLYLKHLL